MFINANNIIQARGALRRNFLAANKVHTERWQGIDIAKRPEMVSYELLNVTVACPLFGEDLDYYRHQCEPNLPWADDHFLERVSGKPLNPGETWKSWPWAASADKFRNDRERFNHTYMERYWPKYANELPGTLGACVPRHGIRNAYGDMQSLVEMLAHEPLTRQAWIPIFFPEDTGIGDGGRKPCTLGYQFIMRRDRLHVYYPLRSCDFVRHFNDDVYLTVRLLLWVLEQCRKLNNAWRDILPGTYTMHCTSLHIFENDYRQLMENVR